MIYAEFVPHATAPVQDRIALPVSDAADVAAHCRKFEEVFGADIAAHYSHNGTVEFPA